MAHARTHARKFKKMVRKTRSDSTTAQVANFQNAFTEVSVPEYIEIKSDEERVIWNQFAKARAKDTWREFDLVLLSKIVKLEVDIRKHQEKLDASGPLIRNKRETLIENPLLRVVDTLQRQQLAIIRSLSLNQTESDPRTLNATGSTERETSNVVQKYGVASLIAMPSRKQ